MTQEERDLLISDIAAAVRIRNTDTGLSEDEIHWVRNAIKLQEQSLKFRQSIIEKSLFALIVLIFSTVGSAILAGIYSWATQHGYKP